MVKRNIPIEVVTAIESRRNELPGVNIESAPEREYPLVILLPMYWVI